MIFDQGSDIGFIFGMWKPTSKEYNCVEFNPTILFILSLTFFLFYRLITGIVVYYNTQNIWFAIGQILFEYMFYRAIWVNYIMKCKTPCDPQTWLQNMEGLLEAFPQAIMQIFYSIQTGTFEGFVIFSIIFSLLSMTTKAICEDVHILHQNCIDDVLCPFICDILFRVFDVTGRVLMIVVVWAQLGGLIAVIVFGIELLLLIVVSIATRELSSTYFIVRAHYIVHFHETLYCKFL